MKKWGMEAVMLTRTGLTRTRTTWTRTNITEWKRIKVLFSNFRTVVPITKKNCILYKIV